MKLQKYICASIPLFLFINLAEASVDAALVRYEDRLVGIIDNSDCAKGYIWSALTGKPADNITKDDAAFNLRCASHYINSQQAYRRHKLPYDARMVDLNPNDVFDKQKIEKEFPSIVQELKRKLSKAKYSFPAAASPKFDINSLTYTIDVSQRWDREGFFIAPKELKVKVSEQTARQFESLSSYDKRFECDLTLAPVSATEVSRERRISMKIEKYSCKNPNNLIKFGG